MSTSAALAVTLILASALMALLVLAVRDAVRQAASIGWTRRDDRAVSDLLTSRVDPLR